MYRNQETDKERWLRLDLENAQDQLRREHEQQEREKEQRSREWHEEMRSRYRSAESWPEALRKQAHLFGLEAYKYPCDDDGHIPADGNYNRENDYFATGADACNLALKLWSEVENTKIEKRRQLQDQLDAIEMEIRNEVADKLDAENKSMGFKQVAIALRDTDHSPSEWLDW